MYKVDARGEACPKPVLMTKAAVQNGEEEIQTLVDNPTAVENLKRLGDNQGFEVAVREEGGTYALDFTKGEGCSACEKAVNSPLPAAGGDWAVFVGRDIIGDGDRELGTNLMRMFFYTLAQGEDKPGAVLFMNAGVKLPTLDGQVADHLKALSDSGTEILVCGTCLNFYGITDQLKVGTVSNMYDIVTRMQKAAKVISL